MMTTVKTNEHYRLPQVAREKLSAFLKQFYSENPNYGKNPVVRFDAEKSKPVPKWW